MNLPDDLSRWDIVCACDEQGAKNAAALVEWAKQDLSHEHLTVTGDNFLTTVAMHLHWHHHAHFEYMADQWFGVSFNRLPTYAKRKPADGEGPHYRRVGPLGIFIQCDGLEAGLAWCLWKLHQEEPCE